MVNDHTDLGQANQEMAKGEEQYRDEVSRGSHGAHKSCEKFPIKDAQKLSPAPCMDEGAKKNC
jgi:hypothetical protein